MVSRAPTSTYLRVSATLATRDTSALLTDVLVRTTRARIIRLKNDYKELMTRVEKGLHEHHARVQDNNTASAPPIAATNAAPAALEAPFAKVNSVVADSPAEAAGLRIGDTITKFGWVDWTNHDKLARLTQVVSQNEGVSGSAPLHCAPCMLPWSMLTGTAAHHGQGIAAQRKRRSV